jgi:hypothetical protein
MLSLLLSQALGNSEDARELAMLFALAQCYWWSTSRESIGE